MQFSNNVAQLKALDNICHRCKLRNLCSVNTLSARERKMFSDVTMHDERRVRGQHLFLPGDCPGFIYIVHSGSFKTYVTNGNGDTQVTGFYFQGDVLDLNTSHPATNHCGVVALENSTICKISLTVFENMAGKHPALSTAFLKIMSREIMLKHRMMIVLSKMTAEQKAANFLIEMSAGSKSRGYSSETLNLSMSRSDIANYLGLANETISRIFKGFQKKGIIDVELHQISINDFEALKSFLQNSNTSNLNDRHQAYIEYHRDAVFEKNI